MKEKNTENTTQINSKEKTNDLLNELNKSKNEAAENWNLFVRAKAELENIKKRTNKEIINATKYSHKNIFVDLLPIFDSFESYLENEKNKNEKNYTGIRLLYKMLISVLNKNNVKKIEIKKYTDFDPLKHEVISIIKHKIHDNKILSVFQSGYTLHDQIIRYSKVLILKKDTIE